MSTENSFTGFPEKTEYTSIPNPFFSSILPQIRDLPELKITLYIFWALYRKKSYPRFITYSELRGDQSLMSGITNDGSSDEDLQHGLEAAVARGTFLRLHLESDEGSEELYFLNAEQDRRAIEQIESGRIKLGGMIKIEPAPIKESANIFSLYEQHIGLLNPIIADDLKYAENRFPASWIEDAFKESVRMNKRSWRYINTILERWAAQGKDDGRIRENPQTDSDPKEYIRRFGHLTKRD
ncbi:MAG: DnaD domain protein [Chloroflexi bacterium]|nr:DnaD domain protein [Chloroflexota bacterium]